MGGTSQNLNTETEGTEEEAEEGLEATSEMEVDGDGEDDGVGNGKEESDGTLQALGSLELITQDAEPSGKTLFDAGNGFNELSRLAMLWNVRHRWPEGARFALNCYRHWAQLILCQLGEQPVTILIREGVTQGDPLYMSLYGIILVPLADELRVMDSGLLLPFYADDVALDGLER